MISYFKTVTKSYSLFIDSYRKASDQFQSEITKQDSKFNLNETLKESYKKNLEFIADSRDYINKLEKEVIDYSSSFSKVYSNKYNDLLTEFKNISGNVTDSQAKLEKLKNKYFESCKAANEQEKLSVKLADESNEANINIGSQSQRNKRNNKETELTNSLEQLSKLRMQAENNSQQYKTQLDINNKLFTALEVKYNKVKERIQDLEENRTTQIQTNLSSFYKNFIQLLSRSVENFQISYNDILSLDPSKAVKTMKKIHKQYNKNPKANLLKLKKGFSHSSYDDYITRKYEGNKDEYNETNKQLSTNIRFPEEEFLSYDILKRNFDIIKNHSLSLSTNDVVINYQEIENISELAQTYKLDVITNLFISEKEVEVESIMTILDQIYSENDKIKKNESGAITNIKVTDKILFSLKSLKSYKVCSYQNFHHLSNLLYNLFTNEKSDIKLFELLKIFSQVYYDINALTAISNNSLLVLNKEQSDNLSQSESTLSLNSYYIPDNNKIKDMFNIYSDNSKLKDDFDKRIYLCNIIKIKNITSTSKWIKIINTIINSKLYHIINDLISKNKINLCSFEMLQQGKNNFFNMKNTYKENKSVEEAIKISKYIEDIKEYELYSVLSDFVMIVSSFDLPLTQVINVLLDYTKSDVLSKNCSDFLITILNSNLFSVKLSKNMLFKNSKSCLFGSSIVKTVKNISSMLPSNSGTVNINKIFAGLITTISYLNRKDINNLALTSKGISKFIRENKYKNILRTSAEINLDNKKRTTIWLFILNLRISNEEKEYKKRFLPQKPGIRKVHNEVSISDNGNIEVISHKSQLDITETSSNNQTEDEINDTSNNIMNQISPISKKLVVRIEPKETILIKEDYFSPGKEIDIRKMSYYEILSIVEKSPELQSIFDIINLDVIRTFHNIPKDEIQEYRRMLNNILKIISYTTTVSYCQGMNYVGSYLLFITNSEQVAFNIFYNLVQATDYRVLFEKELFNLKKYFYIFSRLIEILLPEVNSIFKSHSVHVSFFCSSWFITLFTNLVTTESSIPKILYNIWDEFIISGWRAIMKVAILLLKINEDLIITMKYEDMLQYLLNDVNTSNFFKIDNYNKSINLLRSLKISKELFSNLENEYELKKLNDIID